MSTTNQVPRAIRNAIKSELQRLDERKTIVKVDKLDSRASINRMAVVGKTEGKLRLCLDPYNLNKQIIRKPKLTPTIEEMFSKLIGKRYFTVFDMSGGFHHLRLDEESSWKCCFSTPFGIYRLIVLLYGRIPKIYLMKRLRIFWQYKKCSYMSC